MNIHETGAEIRRLFAAYAAGFDDADPEAITELFAWPATIWQFGEGPPVRGRGRSGGERRGADGRL
jgi:hypothetical protein